MIYIFKGFGEICKLPCTLCKGCCDMFAGCCKSCGECWEPIVNNPLGNYVVGTWVAMAVAAAASGWAIGQLGDCDSDIKGKLALFCIANFALAFIHSGMAYYMQRQIIKGLGGKDYAQMTAKEIQSQAGQVLLYDVPVCLYSFLATAAFGMQCWGLTLGSCGGNEPHGGAAALMITWAVLAFAYLFCWYCCQCCQGTVSKKQTAAGGPPVTVGAQSA
mmetsp:Transcript_74207/g.200693  ORF Transcript_74207/g.200693 Transcript_74207/m.200693 type:complete len:217 (-) Transcript_74207:22-672(-)